MLFLPGVERVLMHPRGNLGAAVEGRLFFSFVVVIRTGALDPELLEIDHGGLAD